MINKIYIYNQCDFRKVKNREKYNKITSEWVNEFYPIQNKFKKYDVENIYIYYNINLCESYDIVFNLMLKDYIIYERRLKIEKIKKKIYLLTL